VLFCYSNFSITILARIIFLVALLGSFWTKTKKTGVTLRTLDVKRRSVTQVSN
jgi:hypothetical protein